jgi:hypothetical protein
LLALCTCRLTKKIQNFEERDRRLASWLAGSAAVHRVLSAIAKKKKKLPLKYSIVYARYNVSGGLYVWRPASRFAMKGTEKDVSIDLEFKAIFCVPCTRPLINIEKVGENDLLWPSVTFTTLFT